MLLNKHIHIYILGLIISIIIFLVYYKMIEAFNNRIDIREDQCRIYLSEDTKRDLLKRLKGKFDGFMSTNKEFFTRFFDMKDELARLKRIREVRRPTPPGEEPSVRPTPIEPKPPDVKPHPGEEPIKPQLNLPDSPNIPEAPVKPQLIQPSNPPMVVPQPIKPNPPQEPRVTFYQHCWYRGNRRSFPPGRYDMHQIGLPNDSLSSIQIPKELYVQVFEHMNFRGRSIIRFTSEYCLVYPAQFNDKASSWVVYWKPQYKQIFQQQLNAYKQAINKYNQDLPRYNDYLNRRKQYFDSIDQQNKQLTDKYESDLKAYNKAKEDILRRFNEERSRMIYTYEDRLKTYNDTIMIYKIRLALYNQYMHYMKIFEVQKKQYDDDLSKYNAEVEAHRQYMERKNKYDQDSIIYNIYLDSQNRAKLLSSQLDSLTTNNPILLNTMDVMNNYISGIESSKPYIPIDGFVFGTMNKKTMVYIDRISDDQFVGNRAKCFKLLSDVNKYEKVRTELNDRFGEENIRVEKREIFDDDMKPSIYVELSFMTTDMSKYIPILEFDTDDIKTTISGDISISLNDATINSFSWGLFSKRVPAVDNTLSLPDYFRTATTFESGVINNVGTNGFAFGISEEFIGSSRDDRYAVEASGLFKPSASGLWRFFIRSSEPSILWIGDSALAGYTVKSALINNNGLNPLIEQSGQIELQEDKLYPFRIQYITIGEKGDTTISFEGPGVSKRTDGTGHFYNTGDAFNMNTIQSYNSKIVSNPLPIVPVKKPEPVITTRELPKIIMNDPIAGLEILNDGSSPERAALSGWHLAQLNKIREDKFKDGWYWIKSEKMPRALQMYVNFTADGGGYDFYRMTNAKSVMNVLDDTGARALGLDIFYPRSKEHWKAIYDFIVNVSKSTVANDVKTTGAIYRNTRAGGLPNGLGNGTYASFAMRDPRYYPTGAPDWRVPDDGKWFLRDTPYGEPNGDYRNNEFLGLFGLAADGTVTAYNDAPGHYPTGTTIICSTNVKGSPAVEPVIILDGLSASKAAPSAKYLVDIVRNTKDGVYWINIPNIGPTQVYCILNPACAGGGWMMALKGTRGTTFNYDSSYWTSTNTLNTGNTNRSDGDAKFNTYNYMPANDWLAIFPDVKSGGDVSGGYGGWTWVEDNAVGYTTTLREFFGRNVQINKAGNGRTYPATNPQPMQLKKWDSSLFSYQGGMHWYGINYRSSVSWKMYTRWGFAFNNENDQNTNDTVSGIGILAHHPHGTKNWSAGDAYFCCGAGRSNRQMRFEWYIR